MVEDVENLFILRDGQKYMLTQVSLFRTGLRAYLAVSRILSTELRPKPLVNGMRLSLGAVSSEKRPSALNLPVSLSAERVFLRVIAGMQRNSFDRSSWLALYGAAYHRTVQCDRMGIRLSGAAVSVAPK